jgi:hypothetical protein
MFFTGLLLVMHHQYGHPIFSSADLGSFEAVSAERGSVRTLLVGMDVATEARATRVRSFIMVERV